MMFLNSYLFLILRELLGGDCYPELEYQSEPAKNAIQFFSIYWKGVYCSIQQTSIEWFRSEN